MVYNSNCNSQSCSLGCCNYLGNCPSSSSQCYYYYTYTCSNCWYYYTSSSPCPSNQCSSSSQALPLTTIIGIAVGGLAFVFLVIIIACICCRKYQGRVRQQQIFTRNLTNMEAASHIIINPPAEGARPQVVVVPNQRIIGPAYQQNYGSPYYIQHIPTGLPIQNSPIQQPMGRAD